MDTSAKPRPAENDERVRIVALHFVLVVHSVPKNRRHAPSLAKAPVTRGRVLIVDDELAVARAMSALLEHRGYATAIATDVADLTRAVDAFAPEAVVLDYAMPGVVGLEVLAALRAHDTTLTVLMLSGYMDVPTTVQALRAGAEDVLTKPADTDYLTAALERGLSHTRLRRSHRASTERVTDPFGYLDDSPAMLRVIKSAEQLAVGSMPIMIAGEVGTGKRALAQLLHQLSGRVGKPFAMVSCGARDASRVEQTLLGGGVSAAADREAHLGVLSAAAGGTLVLDEPVALTAATQDALLAETLAVGTPRRADVARLVVTTRFDLAEDVRRGALRADLYRELAAMPLMLPPLRMRGDGAVRQLAERFLTAQRVHEGRGPRRFSSDALDELCAAPWPGNVRQLRAVVDEVFALTLDDDVIDDPSVRAVLSRRGMHDEHAPADHSLKTLERRHIARVLGMTGGQRAEAARLLGITRTTLYKKIDDYDIEPARS